MGNRTKGKVKPKSIKTKALDINTKRRIAKFGKKKKSGHEGAVIQYMTRKRALKKLQVSLKDFRRLCILKGIYPRQPRNKSLGKTCYHVKDIAFLAHEPILYKFWEMKAFMKKVRRLYFRKDLYEAKRLMNDSQPSYSLEHLVRERYPRFSDALADLDDALCLLHLFANMRSVSHVDSKRVENCLRLTREWQLYVVLSHSLRKTFVSVKGIYYQCDIQGTTVTWIAPHKFAQNAPKEVDFRVMATFLEFYETMMGFVLFKLYHALGKRYPPRLNMELDASGAHLSCVCPENVAVDDGSDAMTVEPTEKISAKTSAESASKSNVAPTATSPQSAKLLKNLKKKMKEFVNEDDDKVAENEFVTTESKDNGDFDEEERAAFASDPNAIRIGEQVNSENGIASLFKDLSFFLSRETPLESLELVIRAFGGAVVISDGTNSASLKGITHYVTDRPNIANPLKYCEYIQPQWVYDSVNSKLLLPPSRYGPNVKLPPHLSPFVNNESQGYKPEYAEEIEKLQESVGIVPDTVAPPTLRKDAVAKKATESDDESEEEDIENDIEKEIRDASEKQQEEDEGINSEDSDFEGTDDSDQSSETEDDDSSGDGSDDNEEDNAGAEDEEKAAIRDTESTDEAVSSATDRYVSEFEKVLSKPEKAKSSKTFVRAKAFKGEKKGYVFRNGENGVGYYSDTTKGRVVTFKPGKMVSKRQSRLAEKKEEQERARMMMSGKAKRLYGKMQHGIERKKDRANQLMKRRKKA